MATDQVDEESRRYVAAIKEFEPCKSILATLTKPGPSQFDEHSLEQAARVLAACSVCFFDEEENPFHPNAIRLLLSGLANGYGCWLEDIRDAVAKGPFPTEAERAMFQGSLFMAEQFIFHLIRTNDAAPSPVV